MGDRDFLMKDWMLLNMALHNKASFYGLQNLFQTGLDPRTAMHFHTAGRWGSAGELLSAQAAPTAVTPNDLRSQGYIYTPEGEEEERWDEDEDAESAPKHPGDLEEEVGPEVDHGIQGEHFQVSPRMRA